MNLISRGDFIDFYFELKSKGIGDFLDKIPASGLKNIRFFEDDVYTFDFGSQQYDVILFQSSFHHLSRMENCARRIKKALRPNGILVVNEYIGANRFQWSSQRLRTLNEVLKNEIPQPFRVRTDGKSIKSKIYAPGIVRMFLSDPSESAHSSELLG